MWRQLLPSRRSQPSKPVSLHVPQIPQVPAGQRVYAVGDIHGRLDLLSALVRKIRGDLVRSPCPSFSLVFLGDYVDRGPRSRDVVRLLARAALDPKVVALQGNHEAVMLRFLQEPDAAAELWMSMGGQETLASYGVETRGVPLGRGARSAAECLRKRIPASHLTFLSSLPASVTVGDYFFCHAGVRPGVPIEAQDERDLLWIREAFLASDEHFGKVVVHGHTPVHYPELRGNRINVDTGAYASNRLTCLVLEGSEQRFLST